MTKEALILTVMRAQRGDAPAFDVLVRQYQNTAVAYARTLLRDPTAAEDAAQEAFVQAWRDLPRLTEAAAFGAWLRRIVFKFCDRVRRSAHQTLPLDETVPLPGHQEPASLAERADEAGRIRRAIDALPCLLREVTLLYYLTGHDVQEIADFLDVPASTVKNRLHASRKWLRKELWTMAETFLEEVKPSQDEKFARNVLARVLREFQQQEATDPYRADRGLLDKGRTALFQALGEESSPDEGTVRDGFTLLWRRLDWPALAALLMRYLARPLPDSETAWAYLHLANALAIGGSPAGAVLAHEAFERWMPGRSPRLSARWPYFPISTENTAPAYAGDEVGLLFLSQSVEFATAYLAVWRNGDYLAKVDAALERIPVTAENRLRRFYSLRMAYHACEAAGDLDAAAGYVRQMHALAVGAEDDTQRADLRAKALGHEVDLASRRPDEAAFTADATALKTLLDEAEQAGMTRAEWVRAERHDLACQLVGRQKHALALPLWEANAANGGKMGGWGWLLYAATVWQLIRDRERTLALLQEARVNDDRNMLPLFTERPEFEDVKEDAEFLQAVSRKLASA